MFKKRLGLIIVCGIYSGMYSSAKADIQTDSGNSDSTIFL